MPFDFPSDAKAITPPKTLEGLSFVLRNPSLWPADFKWYYGQCGTCAMGLASKLFDIRIRPYNSLMHENADEMARCFGMDQLSAKNIFLRLCKNLGKDEDEEITPEHVADAIDQYLATKA